MESVMPLVRSLAARIPTGPVPSLVSIVTGGPVFVTFRSLAQGGNDEWWVSAIWIVSAVAALLLFLYGLVSGAAWLVRSGAISWSFLRSLRIDVYRAEEGRPRDREARGTPEVRHDTTPPIPQPSPAREAANRTRPRSAEEVLEPPPEREWVFVKPGALIAPFATHTSMEAQRLAADFVGQWMPCQGKVSDIHEYDDGDRYVQCRTVDGVLVGAMFRGAWRDRVGVFRKGDVVQVVGKLKKVSSLGLELDPAFPDDRPRNDHRESAAPPPNDAGGHLFYGDVRSEVNFSEVETTGYDGPKLGPAAKWTVEKSRLERGSVSGRQAPDGSLRGPTAERGALAGDARPAEVESASAPDSEGNDRLLDGDAVTDDMAVVSDDDGGVGVDDRNVPKDDVR